MELESFSTVPQIFRIMKVSLNNHVFYHVHPLAQYFFHLVWCTYQKTSKGWAICMLNVI